MDELSICSGVGSMSLGLKIADDAHRCVGYVEREIRSAEILATRMAEGHLSDAPIYSDLATFDGSGYSGKVDILTAGLPCQPYSVSGAMRGHDDERALWPLFVKVARECRPAFVFIENVPGFRKHFEPVWRHFRELGFEWASPLLQTASESGAPHIRERFFALAAHPERVNVRHESWWRGWSDGSGASEPRNDDLTHPHAHVTRLERRSVQGRQCPDECASGSMGDAPADSDGDRREGEWGHWEYGIGETLRYDPHGRCGRTRQTGTYWETESPVLRVDAGDAGRRVDELRAIGNIGCPPVAYARAFVTLANDYFTTKGN